MLLVAVARGVDLSCKREERTLHSVAIKTHQIQLTVARQLIEANAHVNAVARPADVMELRHPCTKHRIRLDSITFVFYWTWCKSKHVEHCV